MRDRNQYCCIIMTYIGNDAGSPPPGLVAVSSTKSLYRVVQKKRSIRIFFTKSRILARLCSYFQTMVINMISKLCANFRMIAYFLRKPETLEWGSVKSAVNSWAIFPWNKSRIFLNNLTQNHCFWPKFWWDLGNKLC